MERTNESKRCGNNQRFRTRKGHRWAGKELSKAHRGIELHAWIQSFHRVGEGLEDIRGTLGHV